MKQLQQSFENDKILSEMLALEIQQARKEKYPSAQEILEELLC